eukprot:2614182-Rhodomonas_salina.1
MMHKVAVPAPDFFAVQLAGEPQRKILRDARFVVQRMTCTRKSKDESYKDDRERSQFVRLATAWQRSGQASVPGIRTSNNAALEIQQP